MDVTHKQVKGRTLKLLSINSSDVINKNDLGYSRDGTETVTRGQLADLLKKRVVVNGVSLPAFVLAEVPRSLHADDPFDRDILKDRRGDWLLPFPEWEAERAIRVAKFEARSDNMKVLVDKMTTANIVKGLAELTTRGSPSTEKKAPKPEPEHHEVKAEAKVEHEPKKAEHKFPPHRGAQ